ncbi:flavoprotein [Streptomyces sp. NPDC048361]|uniref:flavoprotein n=1 Tax=Streptomyces sp. NPDC048361 TaxID=3154720 RepID=UPI003442775B
MTTRTVYLFCSAAPPVFEVAAVIESLQAGGWDVCLGLTPAAASWIEESLSGLATLTGHPVRWQYRSPGEPDTWPAADVILFAPATFNSVNSWAAGLTSAFVVGVAAEAIGKRIPIVAMPCLNAAYARHPQFEQSVETLRSAGVTVLYGGDTGAGAGFVPNQPGEQPPEGFPWRIALDAVEASVTP